AKPRRSRNRSPVQATSAPRAGTWYRAALRPLVPPLAHPPASLVRSRPALQSIALQSPTPVAEAEHAVVAEEVEYAVVAEEDRVVAEEAEHAVAEAAEADRAVAEAAEADRAVAEEVTARTFRPRSTLPNHPKTPLPPHP